jgi:hypothetical protein
MQGRIQSIELAEGVVVQARITPTGYGAADRDVGVLDAAVARLTGLAEVIRDVGSTVLDAARQAEPQEATVTFGVELALTSGKAMAVLAEGQATGSVQVSLTWRLGGSGADGDA